MKFEKYKDNPILRPNAENEWEERCVLNPAVVYDDETQEFIMLYRDRKSTRLNSSHNNQSRMPSSA